MATRKKKTTKKKKVVKKKAAKKKTSKKAVKKKPDHNEPRVDELSLESEKKVFLDGVQLFYGHQKNSIKRKRKIFTSFKDANETFDEIRDSDDPTFSAIQFFMRRD